MSETTPQCDALAAAKEKTGLSYAEMAEKLGAGYSEELVVNLCTGKVTPKKEQYADFARIFGLKKPVPKDRDHPGA